MSKTAIVAFVAAHKATHGSTAVSASQTATQKQVFIFRLRMFFCGIHGDLCLYSVRDLLRDDSRNLRNGNLDPLILGTRTLRAFGVFRVIRFLPSIRGGLDRLSLVSLKNSHITKKSFCGAQPTQKLC
jgi:hypothetical protein